MSKKHDERGWYLKTRHSHTNYDALLPFLDAVDATEERYFRFTSGGYMPLVIENSETTFLGCPVYSMTHYYEQNGDMMRDPDMTFYVDRERELLIPMTYQQDGCAFIKYGTLYQEVFDGEKTYRPMLLTELDDFLWQWIKNIHEQGFTPTQANASITWQEFATLIPD